MHSPLRHALILRLLAVSFGALALLASGCGSPSPVTAPEKVDNKTVSAEKITTSIDTVTSTTSKVAPSTTKTARKVEPDAPASNSTAPKQTEQSTTTIDEASTSTTVPSPPAPETGEFTVADTTGEPAGTGKLKTYTVGVEQTLDIDVIDVGTIVDDTLSSPQSWIGDGTVSFQRVPSGANFRILIATPTTTDLLCAPLRTNSYFSCRTGNDVVINATRWNAAVADWASSLAEYRTYVINHEVGHLLGHGHLSCPAPGSPAPVMMQQSKSIGNCTPNPWPYPSTP